MNKWDTVVNNTVEELCVFKLHIPRMSSAYTSACLYKSHCFS